MISVLDVPVMPSREAARQLRIPPATLQHWLEGGERRGIFYPPVLRARPLGSTDMTWGEVVEARWLRTYRSRVSMQRLRPFIAAMRDEFGVPYPLAHFRPFVTGRELVFKLQERTDVPDHLWLVHRGKHNQYRVSPLIANDYLDMVEFTQDDAAEAERIRPLGKRRAVVLDPRITSGAATVRGVRTAVLAERERTGSVVDELAEEFGLKKEEVRDGLAYEWSTHWVTEAAA